MSVTDPSSGNPQGTDPNAPSAPAPTADPNAPAPTADPNAPAPPAPGETIPPEAAGTVNPEPQRPSSSGDQPAPSAGDLEAQLSAIRQQLSDLEARQAQGYQSLTASDDELRGKVEDLRAQFADWPQRGDRFADVPQPFDLQGHGLPQPGVTRDHLPGGAPDELSPVVIAHNKPLLHPGMAGDAVGELADLLRKVGYTTSISEGRNHASVFDDTVAAAVGAFKRDFHVLEDPTQWPQDARAAERFVGPWVWEALIRAASLVGI